MRSSSSVLTTDRLLRRWSGLALLSLASLLSGCSGSQQSAESTSAPAPASEAYPSAAASSGALREFSEDELTRYLATFKDLRALGAATDAKMGDDPSRMESMFVGMETNAKYGEILARHGFTQESFVQVHYNVIQAYAAVRLDERRPEIDKSRSKQAAALEEMKGKVSAEQLEMMKQATNQGNQMLDAYKDVPAANKELVRRHQSALEATFGR